jgi:riboflavin synthase
MEIPSQFQKFIAPKGSVAINGVSLTVNGVDKNNFFLNLIPHTIENTTFKTNKINDQFNFEIDMLARYALNG